MVHASLFSGIGGPEVAAAMMGWQNAFHCEINPFGRAVLEYWFPESKSYEDITKTDFREWRGKIDILTGGFPCQPFSYAGKRGGREDERYLWPEMLRAIDEIRPTWVVGENVAGITTMVEGGVFSLLGSEASLFDQDNRIYRHALRQPFTIERICSDLERLGYAVQPVLIPAAAVGAPHRRDRVFIIAHDNASDSYCRPNGRIPGEDEGKSREEWIQEWNKVWLAGEPSELRSEGEIDAASDTDCNRGHEIHEHLQPRIADGAEPVGNGREWAAADTASEGRKRRPSPAEAGRIESGADRPFHGDAARPCEERESSNSIRSGLERTDESWDSEGGERMRVRRDAAGHDWAADEGLLPENRWREFPTVSPVHRGNDGIPIRMDNLSISFSKWRTESLKAYGNAIVPQVMYRIFQAIQSIGEN